MKKYPFLTLVLLINLSLSCFSSSENDRHALRVEFFGVNEGLSQSSVNCLLKDSYGFIWIGTQDGLNRYDGYGFKVFRNKPFDSLSIVNNDILSIAEDRDGNLWIGTWNGLSHYNRQRGQFTNYHHEPNNETTISDNRVYDVYVDRSGTVWIKTATSLDKYDPITKSFIRYPHFNDFVNTTIQNNDFAIFEDSSHRLWVGSKDGLFFFDRNIEHFKRYSHDPYSANTISSNRIKHIYEDSQKNLWVTTDNGINKYRPDKDDFVRYLPRLSEQGNRMEVNFIYENSANTLLVGTNEGISAFDPANGSFSGVLPFIALERPIAIYQYNVMVEDAANILWIGTSGGLIKWDLKEPKFKLWLNNSAEKGLFFGNSIASVHVNGNDLWVGTWGSGLFRYNRATSQNTRFSSGTSRAITNNHVHAICKTSKGQLIIGMDGGVQIFNERTSAFNEFFSNQDHRKLFATVKTYKIAEDKLGRLWFATSKGLHCFNGESLTSYYSGLGKENSISSNEVLSLAIDSDGNIWAGTFRGLNQIRVDSNSVISYLKPKNNSQKSLLSDEILSLHFSLESGLWIGTTNGLHRFNANDNTFTSFTESNGLPNNLINAIEEDMRGRIWVSTNWGLAVLNPLQGRAEAFSQTDGLQGYEFNLGASYHSPTGEIFFGGVMGLNYFHPDSIRASSPPPKLAFTNLEKIGRNMRISKPIDGTREIEISNSFGLINIEFSALDFTHPSKNRYMYQMIGLDDAWINLEYQRSVSFSHLNEGVYILRVKGANSDRVWNENAIELRIVVRPNFFESRIARIFYILLFVIIIGVFLLIRFRNLLKTKRLLSERSRAIIDSERQKEELVVKNKSITDSINYAKRIQEAILPSETHFNRILPDSFILYMPKDIVSGDFYWVNETHNKIFVAAVDCTGHGVPGAFMSIIGVELLRNITNIQGVNDAAEILNRLHRGINDTFAKGIDENVDVKDGMDVSFCVIDKENNQVQFAGAFTSLYLIRNSKIIEIKGDRLSVGMGETDANTQFTSHFVTVEPDDMLYIFTDGYVDQFGGVEGKKFKFRRFRHLLLSIHKLPLEEQRQQLYDSIAEWRGEHEQVDDILIIGIKPDLSCLF